MKKQTITNIEYYAIYADADGNINKLKTAKSILRFRWHRFVEYTLPYNIAYFKFIARHLRLPNVKDAASGSV